MPAKNYCLTCNKSGIIMLCDRCQQTYCDKHMTEHRQQYPNQLDNILQEYDFIQEEVQQNATNQHPLLKSIDKWEKDSIIKIQTRAETLREELREMIENAKERFVNVCNNTIENLHSTRKIGQFCQNDLYQTMEQLNGLKTKISSLLSVHLIEDKNSSLHLMTIKGTDFMNQDLEKSKIYSITKRVLTSDVQEKFSKVIGPITIIDHNLVVRHNGPNATLGYILGEQKYSQGRQTIRFKLEQIQTPYNIFFGCISSSQSNTNKIHYKSSAVAGWFGHNEVYQHGSCNKNAQMHGYDSDKLQTYDVVSLTFDCDEKQIEFYPERTKKIHELPIDLEKIPFPWQLLIILTYANDCVKILYNA